MKRNRSIKYKLEKTKNKYRRAQILREWANDWKNEHIDLIERLKNGIDSGNMDEIRISLGSLRAVTNKKHDALHNIFDLLLELDLVGDGDEQK